MALPARSPWLRWVWLRNTILLPCDWACSIKACVSLMPNLWACSITNILSLVCWRRAGLLLYWWVV